MLQRSISPRRWTVPALAALTVALMAAAPARADKWGFSISVGHRDYGCGRVYYDRGPVYYDAYYPPPVYVYDYAPPVTVYRQHYYRRSTVRRYYDGFDYSRHGQGRYYYSPRSSHRSHSYRGWR